MRALPLSHALPASRRRAFVAAFALLASPLLCSCGKKEAAADTLTVGAFLSLSGADSTFGTDTREGIELATDQFNTEGGVGGKKVRVLYEDDKSNAQEASNKVRELIDRDHVIAVLGEVASSRSLTGGSVANSKKVPMVSPSSTNRTVTEGREYVFRACFTDDLQGVQAARFAIDKLGKKKLAILYVAQDAYSSGLASSFREEAKKAGAAIVADKGYQKGETNFTTYLTEIQSAHPDLIFAPNYYNDIVPIARQAKAAGISGSMLLGGDGWDSEDLLKGAGAELEGAYFTNHYAPDVPWPNSRAFVKSFTERYHHSPSSLAAQGFDAARLLYDAMKRAPTLSSQAIRDALAQTKGFQGATGVLSIDEDRNAQKPVVVAQVRGGKFVYFATVGGPESK